MAAEFSLEEIVKATHGKILSTVSTESNGVATDSRQDVSGQLFIALKGDIFDAHQFVGQAAQAGAAVVLVHDEESVDAKTLAAASVVLVEDTLIGLQYLANYYRKKVDPKVIAITGSNGKTSTKEFTAQILKEHSKVHWSKGSFNNHWGVPLSLLSMASDTQIAVLEMGMNNYGEITRLVEIAEPNIVTVTNVGRAHFGFFGSLENIAKAKQEIYDTNTSSMKMIFNLDNDYTREMYGKFRPGHSERCFTYSKDPHADVAISLQLEQSIPGHLKIKGRIGTTEGLAEVPLFGSHNLENIMASCAFALVLGLEPELIWEALSSLKTAWGRSEWVDGPHGAKVLFDGYNANPDSFKSLLNNLSGLSVSGTSHLIGVFGEMLELGEESLESHRILGEQVGRLNFNKVWFYGPSEKSFYEGFLGVADEGKLVTSVEFDQDIAHRIRELGSSKTIYVLKGSRGMAVERVFPEHIPKKPY